MGNVPGAKGTVDTALWGPMGTQEQREVGTGDGQNRGGGAREASVRSGEDGLADHRGSLSGVMTLGHNRPRALG